MDDWIRHWFDSASLPPMAAVISALLIALLLLALWAYGKAMRCASRGRARAQAAHAARAIIRGTVAPSCPTEATGMGQGGNR